MVRRVRFSRVHFWSGHDQYWMGLYGTRWDQEVPEGTQKYLKVPGSTSKYPEVPQSTQKYLKVTRSTSKYTEVPQSTQKYLKVPRSTSKYPEVPQST